MSFYFFLPLSLSLCQTSQDWNAARPYTGSLIVREDIYIYIFLSGIQKGKGVGKGQQLLSVLLLEN